MNTFKREDFEVKFDDFNPFEEFFKAIRSRILFQNKNWLAIITGETGSGKSYSALSMAKMISNKIHVVFNALEFMELLNSDKIEKGSVIIFDEAGVGMSAREWYSQQNKLLGSVLQTFRNMNLAVIFTTPDLSFIDVQARKLFHCYFETCRIDRDKNLAILKPFMISSDGRSGKTYYKFPIIYKGGYKNIIERLSFKKPDDKIIKYYEGLKTNYTVELNRKALEDLREANVNPKERQEQNTKTKLANAEKTILNNKKAYTKEYKNRKFIDSSVIRCEFGLSINESKLIKSRVEQKLFN